MAVIAPTQPPAWPGQAHSHGHIQERLEYWRQQLKTFDAGQGDTPLTPETQAARAEILGYIDHWLDALSDLRGR